MDSRADERGQFARKVGHPTPPGAPCLRHGTRVAGAQRRNPPAVSSHGSVDEESAHAVGWPAYDAEETRVRRGRPGTSLLLVADVRYAAPQLRLGRKRCTLLHDTWRNRGARQENISGRSVWGESSTRAARKDARRFSLARRRERKVHAQALRRHLLLSRERHGGRRGSLARAAPRSSARVCERVARVTCSHVQTPFGHVRSRAATFWSRAVTCSHVQALLGHVQSRAVT